MAVTARPSGEEIEGDAGHAKGGAFEARPPGIRGTGDAEHHGKDADAGDHFDEGIDPKTKEGKGLVRVAKANRNQALDEVIEDREDCKPESELPVTVG